MSACSVEIAISVGERAVKKVSREISTVLINESSKKTMHDNKASFANALSKSSESSASASAEGYGFEGSVSASAKLSFSRSVEGSWSKISDLCESSKTEERYTSKDMLEFADGTTQIYATQTTTISIGGHVVVTEKEIALGVGKVENIGKPLTINAQPAEFFAWRKCLGILEPPKTGRIVLTLQLQDESAVSATASAFYIINVGYQKFLATPGSEVKVWGDGKDVGDAPQNIQWKLKPAGPTNTYYIINVGYQKFLATPGSEVKVYGDGKDVGDAPQNIQWKLQAV